jgi:iron complex transport system substrate-binding protein
MHRTALVMSLGALCLLAQPNRIVSTSPSITEILFALGAGPNVVGVSMHCEYPPQVRQLPRVGTYSRPNTEQIALLRPDLVILHRTNGDAANRLEALGIRTEQVQQGSLAQLFQTMHKLGELTGRTPQAEELISRIQARVKSTRLATENAQRPEVLIIVAKTRDQLTGLIAAGPGTYLGELVEAAGGHNTLRGSQTENYPRISLETVIQRNPDVLIDASAITESLSDTPETRMLTIQPWLTRRELAAVRAGRVAAVTSQALVVPGPRVLDALDMISRAIRGQP